MQTKLTLRMEKALIDKAKVFADASGKSLSKVVADYFALLNQDKMSPEIKITQTVSSLKGIMKNYSVDENDYKKQTAGNIFL